MRVLEEMQCGEQMSQSLQRHRAHLIERHIGRYGKPVSLTVQISRRRPRGSWWDGYERSNDRDAMQAQVRKETNQKWEREEQCVSELHKHIVPLSRVSQ
jgi:hypothetical protein